MKCIRCDAKSFFDLRCSGQHLCKKHFISLFERRVKKTIRQNRLIQGGDHVLVALSGGKDSMVVLKLVSETFSKNPKITVSAATIDEGIRGKKIGDAVKYCESIGVDHHILSFEDSFGLSIDGVIEKIKADGTQACTVCGVLKRRLLNDFSKELGVTKVATGHNLDDEIQSAFMNLLRTDLPRLARLGPLVGVSRHKDFTPRIKILRNTPEEEVKAYADLMKLPYFSNPCRYSTDSLRSTVKQMLNTLEKRHPGSKYQMSSSVDELSTLIKSTLKSEKPKRCPNCGQPSSRGLCKTCIILGKLS